MECFNSLGLIRTLWQGGANFLAIKGTGFLYSIGGNDYFANSICLHVEYIEPPYFCRTFHPVMCKRYQAKILMMIKIVSAYKVSIVGIHLN
jgi:hypothetical protein